MIEEREWVISVIHLNWFIFSPYIIFFLSLCLLYSMSHTLAKQPYKGINQQEALGETSQNSYEQLRQLLLASLRCFSAPLPSEADSQGRWIRNTLWKESESFLINGFYFLFIFCFYILNWRRIALQCSVSFCCTIKAVFLKAPIPEIPTIATTWISSDLALGHLKRARQACNLAHLCIFKLLPKIPLF